MTGSHTSARGWWFAFLLPILLLGARCPVPGQTNFVSGAYPSPSIAPYYPIPLVALNSDAIDRGRPVVEGDLFRVLAPGRLLNLNSYRGLQVIDVGDVTQPRITGRLPLAGQPVEMYVVGDVAFVLLNDVRFFGDISYRGAATSRVVSVVIRDPAHPLLLDQVELPGSIRTSRLTQQGARAALYVVASGWIDDLPLIGGSRTIVASFDVANGLLTPVDRLDLGGSVTAVQATAELLMVARQEDWSVDGGSRVALVDIRDPSGAMVPGDEVAVAGQVYSQFNMDFHGGVVRVVSGRGWGNYAVNTLQTFEASDPSDVAAIDTATFGAGENLFATLFLGNRAFAVTYLRVDPFHAVEISDEGLITPRAEFEVSGWNDFFRAVEGDSRLIGIGVDDQVGRTLAVSLYDVSDLANPEPLLARERVAAENASSEASYDHRAFSVLEGAVSVPAPNGVVETGLVLLPYTAWDAATTQSIADVQLFTFSADTLTRRGSMSHGTAVRRSFAAGPDVVANLSEEKLSLFGTADPDRPAALGSVDLAPNYSDVLRFGDYRARVVDGSTGAFPWYAGVEPPTAVEVIPAGADPDLALPVARFELAPGAVVHRTGSILVSIAFDSDGSTSGATPASEITVYDLGDPTQPRQVGQLRSDRLLPSYGYGYGMVRDVAVGIACFGCVAPWPGASHPSAAIPGGLAFLQGQWDRPWTLDVLDLSDPAVPRFADAVALGAGVEGLSLLVAGSDAWVGTKHVTGTDRRGRSSARYFALRVDVSDPSAPVPDPPINVPGELVAVDGARIFTRDLQWDGDTLETAVVRLALEPPLARVEAVRWFPERNVERILLDGAGHVLVLHGPQYRTLYYGCSGSPLPTWSEALACFTVTQVPAQVETQTLTLLDAGSDDLAVLSDTRLEDWVSLLDAIPGRALLRASEGVLIFGLDDASAPHPRAFHPWRGSVDRLRLDGRDALLAGGRYGLQRIDLDAVNLPPE